MTYEHTQSRPEPTAVLAALTVIFAVLAFALGEPSLWFSAAVLVAISLVGYALSSLTTTITEDAVEVAFRWGRPQRRIPLTKVTSAAAVRNSWWHGWGVRWIPGGTMFNVWGLDAVHLEIEGDRDFRIGTDDPQGLAAAIEAAGGPGR